MKWYWIALLALSGVVVLVLVVGALLPVHHQASRRALFHQPAAAVWAAITDVQALPTWRKELQRTELLPEQAGHRCYREISLFGHMDLRIEEFVPEKKLVGRIITPDSSFGGTWTFRLEPADAGTQLTITENGEIYNVVFRVLARFVLGHTATIEGYLNSLAAKFGEAATIEGGIPDPPLPEVRNS